MPSLAERGADWRRLPATGRRIGSTWPDHRSRRSAIARRGASSDRRCAGRLAAAGCSRYRQARGPGRDHRQRPGPGASRRANCPTACPRRGTWRNAQRAAGARWSRRKLRPRHWRSRLPNSRRQVRPPRAAPNANRSKIASAGRIVRGMQKLVRRVVVRQTAPRCKPAALHRLVTAGGNENQFTRRAARMHAILGHTCDIITM